MIDTIILCYEYNGSSSTNPNAVCLHNIVTNMEDKSRFLVLTTSIDSKSCNNICVVDQISFLKIYIREGVAKKRLLNFKDNVDKLFPELVKEFNIRNVLAISFPFNIAEIAYGIKKKYININFLLYSLDPYAYNDALRFRKFLWLYRFIKENKVFKTADKIFLTYELHKFYQSTPFFSHDRKFIKTGIPILSIKGDEFYQDMIIEDRYIKIIYAGSLSLKYRDPNYILDLFVSLKNTICFKIYFYGSDHLQISDKIKDSLGDAICILPAVNKFKLTEIFKKSDFLLNIGNAMNNQLPSKIIEYIGFRKPIINLIYTDTDPSTTYLKSYPLNININRSTDRNKNLLKLVDFISANKGKLCEQKYIKESYAYLDPKNISSKITQELI